MDDPEIELTHEKTVERFNSRYGHRQKALGFLGTAEGAAIAARLVDRLDACIDRELAAPTIQIVKGEGLRLVLQRVPAEQVALAVLDGVLNDIKDRDKKRRRRPPGHKSDARLLATMAIGNSLHLTCRAHDICRDPEVSRAAERSIAGGRRPIWESLESTDTGGSVPTEWRVTGKVEKKLRNRRDRNERIMWWADRAGVDRWDNIQIGRAGIWGRECVLRSLSDVFVELPDGGLGIYEHAVDDAAAIAGYALLRRPAHFPSTSPPEPWAGWDVGGYSSLEHKVQQIRGQTGKRLLCLKFSGFDLSRGTQSRHSQPRTIGRSSHPSHPVPRPGPL
jgi:hypothetical protein